VVIVPLIVDFTRSALGCFAKTFAERSGALVTRADVRYHRRMKGQGYAEVILRFLRTVILVDLILAGMVGLISFLMGVRTLAAYGSALIWTGMTIVFIAALMAAGGFSARAADVGAYSLSGAGNQSENMLRMAESRLSSLGCFFLLLVAGLGLIATGYLLPVLSYLLEK
jgi:hypothetical protein